MSQNETLKIKANTDNIVEFMYNEPKTGTNNYGDWFLYGVKNDGKEVGIFATEALHRKLSVYRAGDTVNIRKEEYEPGKFGWTVAPQSSGGSSSPSPVGGNVFTIDARTHDIHKQVCLKLAVDLLGSKDGILTDAELVSIDANMQLLLKVLEGVKDEQDDDHKEETDDTNPPF